MTKYLKLIPVTFLFILGTGAAKLGYEKIDLTAVDFIYDGTKFKPKTTNSSILKYLNVKNHVDGSVSVSYGEENIFISALRLCKNASGRFEDWTFFKGLNGSYNIKSLTSVVNGQFNIFNSSVCGTSEILTDIGLFSSYVQNVTVESAKIINFSGTIIGEPHISIKSTKTFSIYGDFIGSMNLDSSNNIIMDGHGVVKVSRLDDGTFPQTQEADLDLDGKFELKDVNNYDIFVKVRGLLAISTYYAVEFGMNSSIRNSLDGTSTFKGYHIDQSILRFSGSLDGNASVFGTAYIGGENYTSLSLSYPYVPGIGEFISIGSGGGDISINGPAAVNIGTARGFTLSHNCWSRVSVLIANAPDNLTLDPEGMNQLNFLYCTFENGMKCDPSPPCHYPDP